MKVVASTVEDEEESDEDKVYVLKSIADDLCQPQVKKNRSAWIPVQSPVLKG